ncbi:spermidine/putrescine ABC transporter substrate-binding protein [Candidatus Saccharibacteria bacterium]|nr:spermidine/putrescine ABC transporter substrate-binding protein [Candidatus Saccharibacteria bacterium]
MKEKNILVVAVLGIVLACGLYFAFSTRSERSFKNGEVNVLNWTSYIPDDVISDFEKEFGIRVNYGTYSSNEELLAKLSSSNEGAYDLVFPSDYMVELLIQRGMLEKMDKERLRNFSNIDSLFLNQDYDSSNEYSLPFLLAYAELIYDASKIRKPISSYRDLINKDYRNNIILINDQRIIIGSALLATGAEMNSVKDEELEMALKFFEELKPNIKAFDSDSPKTFLITKEAEIGLIWNAEATLAKNENPNLKTVFPKEGFAISMDNYCIPKNSKNRANAYRLIDFLLREDISARIVEEYPYISPNNGLISENEAEIQEILENGSYVENVGVDIKKLDRLWARFK